MNQKERDRQEAIARLREMVKPGDTIHTILRHRSRTGMSRIVQAIKLEGNDPLWLGWNIAKAIDHRYDEKNEGVVMGGCGMDMGFALVYELSHALWPDGFDCIGEHCPSNDHNNGDRDYTPHWHKSGGYALKQRWL